MKITLTDQVGGVTLSLSLKVSPEASASQDTDSLCDCIDQHEQQGADEGIVGKVVPQAMLLLQELKSTLEIRLLNQRSLEASTYLDNRIKKKEEGTHWIDEDKEKKQMKCLFSQVFYPFLTLINRLYASVRSIMR